MKKTVCLNMIVKDESSVIRRCLQLVKPVIDHWVIVDTGSTDGTQEIIRDEMKEVPGSLYERPWVDFSYNRTEALQLAKGKGDYALLIDADEQLILKEGFIMPDLVADLYLIEVNLGTLAAHREILVNNSLDWYWKGVLHEQITLKTAIRNAAILENAYNQSTLDGNRSTNPKKFEKDLQVLLKGLEEEPTNSRYVFYIAQTYAALGKYAKAMKYYEKRTSMGGWHQEIYQSLYRIGLMQEILHKNPSEIIQSYMKAHRFLPCRAEPIFRIAFQYYQCGIFEDAKKIAMEGMKIPPPQPSEAFYIEPVIYHGWMRKLYADCCLDLGEDKEAVQTYEALIGNQAFTEKGQDQICKSIALLKSRNQFLNKKNSYPRELEF